MIIAMIAGNAVTRHVFLMTGGSMFTLYLAMMRPVTTGLAKSTRTKSFGKARLHGTKNKEVL